MAAITSVEAASWSPPAAAAAAGVGGKNLSAALPGLAADKFAAPAVEGVLGAGEAPARGLGTARLTNMAIRFWDLCSAAFFLCSSRSFSASFS
jgi:hypothetical protein